MKHLYSRIPVIIVALFFLTLNVGAQTWQSTVPIVSGGVVQVQDITTDASDNVYTVGIFNTSITAPVAITGSASKETTVIIRADATGTPTFNKQITGSNV